MSSLFEKYWQNAAFEFSHCETSHYFTIKRMCKRAFEAGRRKEKKRNETPR